MLQRLLSILPFLGLFLTHSALIQAQYTGEIQGVVKEAETGEALPFANVSIEIHHLFGSISGKVTDVETGEAMPFANVKIDIEGNTVETTTDFDGVYQLDSIPVNNYSIDFRFIGYQTRRFDQVLINQNDTTKLDVKMDGSQKLEVIEIINVTIPMINTIETRTGIFIHRTRSGHFVPHTIF